MVLYDLIYINILQVAWRLVFVGFVDAALKRMSKMFANDIRFLCELH